MELPCDGRITGLTMKIPIIIIVIIISRIIIIHDRNSTIGRSSPNESGHRQIRPTIDFISRKCDIIIFAPTWHCNSIQVDFGIGGKKIWCCVGPRLEWF